MLTGSARTTIASLEAKIAALEAQIGAQQPATGKAEQPVTFYTKAQIAAGGGFPCVADEPCEKRLRTAERAKSHGEAGHYASK